MHASGSPDSFAPVSTLVAAYFDTTVSAIDLLVVVVTLAGMPVSLISTWVIDRVGLRWTILSSTSLAFSGALMKCLVTFPGLEEEIDKGVQYWVTLVAQFLIGVASPLALCLPNKVYHECQWMPLVPQKKPPPPTGHQRVVPFERVCNR